MVRRILIDGAHPEEPRIVIADDGRLEEFDFETAAKKLLKGNIYLAKVTRVEPSLQAAFVEYGGNRQGFLPFAEIHYDYFQIPTSDKEKFKELESKEAVEAEAQDALAPEGIQALAVDASFETMEQVVPSGEKTAAGEEVAIENAFATVAPETSLPDTGENREYAEPMEVEPEVDVIGQDTDAPTVKRSSLYRKYKIQDVIKRNQIVLIQVVKEERGNKGASLTTYISIAGRYCVFMPNTPSQGGLSRRISSNEDRRRLREIMHDLEMPDGGSMIIRTAGVDRNKQDIKRDFEYLQKLWNSVREMAVSSEAPTLVYEEGNLIKRFIRDMYHASIEEIVVEGEETYNNTRETMKMFLPSHAARVKQYTEKMPLFRKYQIEDELVKLYDNRAYLKSGGYIVINPTEALVSIDVNSGRATKERNVEETAAKTNLEAAYEIARQLRLRDLAGLVVIDFIDMGEGRNRRAVERALKDALSTDRARIQVGRISPFGLMEMSRQRLRSSFLESNTVTCPHCNGTGMMRSHDSVAVDIIRAIENEAAKGKYEEIHLGCSPEVAVFVLNSKRQDLNAIETNYGVKVVIRADQTLVAHNFLLDKNSSVLSKKRRDNKPESELKEPAAPIQLDSFVPDEAVEGEEEDLSSFAPPKNKIEEIGARSGERDDRPRGDRNDRGGERGERGGRNRRRRGGRNRDNRPPRADGQPHPAPQQTNTPQPQAASAANDAGDANGGQRYRYRGGQREGQAPRENYNNGGAAVKLEERPQQSSQPAAAAMGEHDAARQSIIKGLWRKITE